MAYDHWPSTTPSCIQSAWHPEVLVPLIIASYVGGILHATVHTVATFSLSFCASSEIRHIFCDCPLPSSLFLALTLTRTSFCSFALWALLRWSTVLIVLISYGFILLAMLRMHSAEGRRKVFSTCGSHPNGSVHLPWDYPLHVLETKFQLCFRP